MTSLLEKIDVMMEQWAKVERKRKKKNPHEPTSDSTSNPKVSTMFEEASGSQERKKLHEGNVRAEHRSWRLEMPIFVGENLDGWIFRSERYFNMISIVELGEIRGGGNLI